ncbi:MAG: prolipoprotein diacylglyceryl transferase [Deltaproteobacteria bacterium]|jgi:phosphatidylglycerol:prolipoprotein diacylglycerol transferase|nr:prolipoprotein diacylglyceryl transferase [Deltaproteobacteria bacterium]
MLPHYILFNHLVINFYGLFVSFGVASALFMIYKSAPSKNINPKNILNFSICVVLIGLMGSRIFFVIFNWHLFSGFPISRMLAFWRGGLMFQGGPIVAVLASPYLLKKYGLKFWPAADIIAPSLALGQGVGRIGCFFAGCCYGRETSPHTLISVVFPASSQAPSGVPLWPAQLMESVCLLALSFLLVRASKKNYFKNHGGLIAGLYLFCSGLLRFIMESFRNDNRGSHIFGYYPTTLISLSMLIFGLIVLVRLKKAINMELTAE